jgi:hypothetical protein
MAVLLIYSELGTSRIAKCLKESGGFSKILTHLPLLIMGDKGLVLVLVLALVVLLVIEDI